MTDDAPIAAETKVVARWKAGDGSLQALPGVVVSGNDQDGYRVNVSMGINILFQRSEITIVTQP